MPTKIVTLATIVALVLAIAGCSNPHNEPIPKSDQPTPASYPKAIARLSPEDKALLDAYFNRHPYEVRYTELTIGEAIADQRRWLEGEPARRALNDEARRQMATFAEVRVVERERDTSKRDEPVRVKVAIHNIGMQGIRRVEGIFDCSNGNERFPARVVMDLEVDTGATGYWQGYLTTTDHGIRQRGESLGNQPLERYVFKWQPTAITLADSSRVFTD